MSNASEKQLADLPFAASESGPRSHARGIPGELSTTATLWILYCSLFLVDFFLTSDPLSAALATSEYAIGPQLLGGLVVVAGLIFAKATRIRPIISALGVAILLSGFLSGGLASRPLSYFFDLGALQLCSTLAYNDVHSFPRGLWIGKTASRLFLGAILVGFVAVLLNPKFGTLYAALSRDLRSLIALWYFLGFYSYAYAFFAAFYFTKRSAGWALALIPFTIVATLSYKRTFQEVIFTSFLVAGYLLFACGDRKSDKTVGKWILAVAAVTLPLIVQLLLLKGPGQVSAGEKTDLTNGRADLWAYYLKKFLESPFYGNGAYFADKAKDYYGTAVSEIGVLRWFTEFGAIYALLILGLCFYAIYCIFKVVRTQPKLVSQNPQFVFVAVMICACFPIFLTESLFTLQSPDGFLYWYSIFYAIWFWGRVKEKSMG